MYKLLERAKIPFAYEKYKFPVVKGFKYEGDSFEKQLNGKGDFKERGAKKFKDSIYMPDFTSPLGVPLTFVIEVKGRSFPDFPRTWKLFKKYLLDNSLDTVILFVPRTKLDCEMVIKILKDKGHG